MKSDLTREFSAKVKFKIPAFSGLNKISRSQPTNNSDQGNDQADRKFETEKINLNVSNLPKPPDDTNSRVMV